MSDLYIVQGQAGHLAGLEREAKANLSSESPEVWSWTCPSTVKKDDLMLVYLLSPISAIVAQAIFSSPAYIESAPESEWFGKSMAYYRHVHLFSRFISLQELRLIFPEWHWTKRPQGSVRVPDTETLNLKAPFLDLLIDRLR